MSHKVSRSRMREAVTLPTTQAYKIPANPTGVISFRANRLHPVHHLSTREVKAAMSEAQIREAFDACDIDKSGQISCSELGKVLQAIGYADKAEESAAVSVVDLLGNGSHSDSGKASCLFLHTVGRFLGINMFSLVE